MKYLLDNRLAPLTFQWGFIKAPLQAVNDAYTRWQKTILHSVKTTAVDLPLADALRRLEPLDMGSQRVLFLSTHSAWTSCFDNGARGGNPATIVGYLCEKMGWRGLTCASIPNTLTRRDKGKRGTWGAVMFTLYAPEPRDHLNIERHVSVINDVGGWTFTDIGKVQDFEQPERYAARRICDRFTPEMLEAYCAALGINLFAEEFYGGPGFLSYAYIWFLPKSETITLSEAQRRLGQLVSGKPPKAN